MLYVLQSLHGGAEGLCPVVFWVADVLSTRTGLPSIQHNVQHLHARAKREDGGDVVPYAEDRKLFYALAESGVGAEGAEEGRDLGGGDEEEGVVE